MHAIFRLKSDTFVTRKVGGEMVLVPLVNSVADMTRVLTLNETGTSIIEALDGKNNLEQVIAKLYEEYDVEMSIIQKDLQQFIEEALSKNLIEKILPND